MQNCKRPRPLSHLALLDASSPKGRALGMTENFPARMQSKVCGFAARMFPQETSAAAAAYRYIPSRENGIAERPQAFRYPENQNNSSAIYAQSECGAHFKSSVPPLPQALQLTTQSPTWRNSAAGCAAATKRASDCGARRGAMHGWPYTGAPDTLCPGCASSG